MLFSGMFTFLRQVYLVPMPLNPYWNCKVVNTLGYTSTLCSTLLILCMTFERFYSIIQPHKAASFNTVKKAKNRILSIVIFSILYNFPNFFVTIDDGVRCTNAPLPYVEIYYWLSFAVNFLLPFVFLLTMNTVIIHTLRKRAKLMLISSDAAVKGQNGSKNTKMKSSEAQIYVTLLMVTFGFLILTTPPYVLSLFIPVVNFSETPKKFAGFYLSFQVAQKTFFTNNCINFFFYVMSGRKFRTDLIDLFRCGSKNRQKLSDSLGNSMMSQTNCMSLTENDVKISSPTVNDVCEVIPATNWNSLATERGAALKYTFWLL